MLQLSGSDHPKISSGRRCAFVVSLIVRRNHSASDLHRREHEDTHTQTQTHTDYHTHAHATCIRSLAHSHAHTHTTHTHTRTPARTHALADQSSLGVLFVLGLLVLVCFADYTPVNLELYKPCAQSCKRFVQAGTWIERPQSISRQTGKVFVGQCLPECPLPPC